MAQPTFVVAVTNVYIVTAPDAKTAARVGNEMTPLESRAFVTEIGRLPSFTVFDLEDEPG